MDDCTCDGEAIRAGDDEGGARDDAGDTPVKLSTDDASKTRKGAR